MLHSQAAGLVSVQEIDCGIFTSMSTAKTQWPTQQRYPFPATTTTDQWDEASQKTSRVAVHQSQVASFESLIHPISTLVCVRCRWWRCHLIREAATQIPPHPPFPFPPLDITFLVDLPPETKGARVTYYMPIITLICSRSSSQSRLVYQSRICYYIFYTAHFMAYCHNI